MDNYYGLLSTPVSIPISVLSSPWSFIHLTRNHGIRSPFVSQYMDIHIYFHHMVICCSFKYGIHRCILYCTCIYVCIYIYMLTPAMIYLEHVFCCFHVCVHCCELCDFYFFVFLLLCCRLSKRDLHSYVVEILMSVSRKDDRSITVTQRKNEPKHCRWACDEGVQWK